ncbi:MAG: hypothetical protein K6F49_02050 [Saccharofermentans sp.]|nr:hypothetical protein [Saccharofermentans sp.]
MKFESNLNDKDKKTIALVLGAAVVFLFCWFGIRPTVNDILELDGDIDTASLKQTEYKNKIINLSSAETIFGRAVTDLSDSTEEYYPMMQSSDIDRMMTSYVLEFGLYPESMNITMPVEPVVEAPYVYSDIEQVTVTPAPLPTATPTPAANSTGSGNNESSTYMPEQIDSLFVPYNDARTNAVSTASSGIYCVTLSYTVTGSEEACQSLIDDLSVKPSIRLTGFEWQEVDQIAEEQEDGTVIYVDSENVRLRVDFNLYMTDIADYEEVVQEAVDAAVVEE